MACAANHRVQSLLATALLAAAVGCAGCAISAPGDPSEPTVDSRVTVLPDLTGMVVDAESVTIPRDGNGSLASLAAGDIVVSTVGEGFLRRIDAVTLTASSFVFATSDAELPDALIDAQLVTALGGEGKADTHQLPTIGFRIADRQLLDNPAISARIANASLAFAPEIDLDLKISDRSVEAFELILRGRVTGALDLEVDAYDAAAGPEIVLWESPPAIFHQQVGILPVVETVTTSVVIKLQATAKGHGRIRVHADALATLVAGVRYTSEAGWNGVADVGLTTHGSVPEASVTFEQVGIRVWLAARADVRLYGVAGPFVAAGPQASVYRATSDGHIGGEVGFRAAAGGGLKFLRLNVPALPTYDLFDVTRPIL